MYYQLFGISGLGVSSLCLGTLTFAKDWGGSTAVERKDIFDAFLEAGGNFINTADV